MFTTLIWMCLDQKDALVGLSYSKSLLRAWKGMTSQHHVIFLAAVIHIPIHVDLEWYATNIYGSVSRLAAPKTLNCFILGFGFNGSFSTHSPKCIEGNSLYAAKIEPENHPELKRKNHLPKLQFLGFQRYISRVAVPRLDRAMSDPCLIEITSQQSNKPGSIFTAQGGGFRVVSPAAMGQELHEKIRTDGWRWLSSKWKLCQVVWDVKMEICSVNLCLFFPTDDWFVEYDFICIICCWVMACGARS